MRKVLNRKLYDTDTAEVIGDWESCCDRGNFHYYREVLHRKRTGELFLYGEGHGLSPYGKTYVDGMRGWGESIEPLSQDAANVVRLLRSLSHRLALDDHSRHQDVRRIFALRGISGQVEGNAANLLVVEPIRAQLKVRDNPR